MLNTTLGDITGCHLAPQKTRLGWHDNQKCHASESWHPVIFQQIIAFVLSTNKHGTETTPK